MTPHSLTKQALDEFKVRFDPRACPDKPLTELKATIPQHIIDWYTSTITRLLEAEIERLEGMRKKVVGTEMSRSHRSTYNTALDDHIHYLKAELAKIKEI